VIMVAVLVYLLTARQRVVVILPPPLREMPEGLKIENWDSWMQVAPRLVQLALDEGGSPEDVVASLMKRLAPNTPWPPPPGHAQRSTWDRMVAVARAHLGVTAPHPLSEQPRQESVVWVN
jgi:hypothetical protein